MMVETCGIVNVENSNYIDFKFSEWRLRRKTDKIGSHLLREWKGKVKKSAAAATANTIILSTEPIRINSISNWFNEEKWYVNVMHINLHDDFSVFIVCPHSRCHDEANEGEPKKEECSICVCSHVSVCVNWGALDNWNNDLPFDMYTHMNLVHSTYAAFRAAAWPCPIFVTAFLLCWIFSFIYFFFFSFCFGPINNNQQFTFIHDFMQREANKKYIATYSFERREKEWKKKMDWHNEDGQHSSHTHAKTHLIKRNQHAHSELRSSSARNYWNSK